MKSSLKSLLLCSCLGLGAQSVHALASETTMSDLKPLHSGKTMAQITSTLGEPEQKLAAVGQPPITRWQYANQTVYFENDRVIHTVEHRQAMQNAAE